jgi:hypothetical protein
MQLGFKFHFILLDVVDGLMNIYVCVCAYIYITWMCVSGFFDLCILDWIKG